MLSKDLTKDFKASLKRPGDPLPLRTRYGL
jgi:hypothetical protein